MSRAVDCERVWGARAADNDRDDVHFAARALLHAERLCERLIRFLYNTRYCVRVAIYKKFPVSPIYDNNNIFASLFEAMYSQVLLLHDMYSVG